MAHSSADQWNESYPVSASETIAGGAAEIRFLRAAVRQRLLKEHVEPAGDNVGGEHLQGSAVSYFGKYSGGDDVFPIYRPDGVTLLTEDDLGRVAYDSESKRYYILTDEEGPIWTDITQMGFDPVDYAVAESKESITFPNGLIFKQGTLSLGANSSGEVTFNAAFNTILRVLITQIYNADQGSMESAYVKTKSTTKFTAFNVANYSLTVDWMAIGY